MRFTLEFDMDNAAFHEAGPDVTIPEVLREVADAVASQAQVGRVAGVVRDVNGNRIGKWEVTA